LIYTGIKNLSGKPRPDFLAICQPDLSKISSHTVGRYGQKISPLWVNVDRAVCQQPDRGVLNDGLRSFPSGYATSKAQGATYCGRSALLMNELVTVAFAGLWYLSFWLCSRFQIIPPSSQVLQQQQQQGPSNAAGEALLNGGSEPHPTPAIPHQSSAPSLLFLFLPYIPLGLAIFIAGTRYFDFRNHGVDVLAGALVGSVTAWFGFRLYHPSSSTPGTHPFPPRTESKSWHSSLAPRRTTRAQ
jgi:hypothetical protein